MEVIITYCMTPSERMVPLVVYHDANGCASHKRKQAVEEVAG